VEDFYKIQLNPKSLDPKKSRVKEFLRNIFVIQKLRNKTGVLLLSAFAIIIAVETATSGITFGALLLVVAVGVPAIYGVVAYPQFGIAVQIIMAFFLFMLMRWGVPGPIGTLMDALQLLLIIGMLIRQKKERNWQLFKGPVTVVLLTWLGYNILEFGNPVTEARMAWIYTIRSVAIVSLSYFIFLYNIRTIQFVRFIFKLWLLLCFIGAAYAFKQEYIGFSAAEDAYLHSDPAIADLLFIAGHWRKFSIFSDPVSFSYNMVMPAIFCICIIAGKFSWWKKALCGVLTIMCLMAMLYSGTRGANVLLPAALLLFAILNYSKKVLIGVCMAAVFLVFLIVVPSSNPNIQRFQTAFSPNNDDSYNVRKANQKRIQPYILTHPMGGGLGSTGEWGKRFAPGSYLSHFPPDSGYIRVAVEDGWIGLIILCTLMFVILRAGINNYYQIQNPELKTYCLAMTLVIFAYNIANFPQEALVQFPSNIMFYLEAALINVTLRLDIAEREKQSELTAAKVLPA
jgi:hypothetical protein